MADKVRLINAEKLKRKLIEGDGHDDDRFTEGYNCAVNDIKGYIDEMPTIEAITREEFIRKAKELITAFVGSGEKTEENRILFALVFGNLELRLFGSEDGDSE